MNGPELARLCVRFVERLGIAELGIDKLGIDELKIVQLGIELVGGDVERAPSDN